LCPQFRVSSWGTLAQHRHRHPMEPFACPHCQSLLLVPARYAGQTMPCPNCKMDLTVPPQPGGGGLGRCGRAARDHQSGRSMTSPAIWLRRPPLSEPGVLLLDGVMHHVSALRGLLLVRAVADATSFIIDTDHGDCSCSDSEAACGHVEAIRQARDFVL
jgi:hypothetical protein